MVQIDPSLVQWSAVEAERDGRPLLVLLHGVGSHEGDLIALAPYLPQQFVVASLRAPLPHGDGFSWYPLSTPGAPDPGAVDDAAEAVLAWLDSLATAHPSVSLLGFSQGGSLSLQLIRHAPERFAFAAVLAGFVVPAAGDDATLERAAARDDAVAAVRPSVFYGRGDVDQIIPADAVERTSAWLEAHADAEQTVYPGLAHGISQEELDDLNAFIGRVTAVPAVDADAPVSVAGADSTD
ncbi:alpha/beta fold hydrolase [Frigoribacterium sp. CFBP 8759]|uniref:alpha/beta hydrolase n=1 Tax=Frigoribacterium sp. CFBP 8759 TaxID=2775283 RepID=UPI001785343A|nr:alpha/beta hydrolase-fold protein [Frigoribacterium sp. CFBP 8759]MBD8484890.1 alpha/beta fold hydrolase [Frigoribacterium sp. CFBP 8759]